MLDAARRGEKAGGEGRGQLERTGTCCRVGVVPCLPRFLHLMTITLRIRFRCGVVLDGLRRAARKVLGWPRRCKLAHEFLWEYSCKMLKLAQLLGQLGVFLTL